MESLTITRAKKALKADIADVEATLTELAEESAPRSAVIASLQQLRDRRQRIRKKTVVDWHQRALWLRQEGSGIPPDMFVLYALAFNSSGRLVGWGREKGCPVARRQKVFARNKTAESVVERALCELMR